MGRAEGLQVAGRVVAWLPLSLHGLSLPRAQSQLPHVHNKGLLSQLWPVAVVLACP